MLRILFFLALGGTVTLTTISESGGRRFTPWADGFLIATIVLGIAWIVLGLLRSALRGSALSPKRVAQARASGRIRAAMIVDRQQTGTFINEQPMVRFTLLVDRPHSEGPPFIATVRQVVSLLDLHTIAPGELLTVAHPDPEHNTVYILDEPLPQQMQALDEAAAARASQLPEAPANPRGSGRRKPIALLPVAFLVGAVGAPFLVTPQAPDYARLIVTGNADQLRYVDQLLLFDATSLQESLASLARESGHDEVFSVSIHDVRLHADVPLTPGANHVDAITIENRAVRSREPKSNLSNMDEPRFSLTDVEWAAVLAGVPAAQELAVTRGLTDAELTHLVVQPSIGIVVPPDIEPHVPVEAHLHFSGTRGSEMVSLDAAGNLLPREELSKLSAEERDSYLFDLELWQAALAQMSAAAGTDRVSRVTNHGSHGALVTHPSTTAGTPQATRVSFINGQVSDIAKTALSTRDPSAGFRLTDIDWATILGQLPAAQTALAEAGMADASVGYIIVAKESSGQQLSARVYLQNEIGQNGSVALSMDGEVQRVYAP